MRKNKKLTVELLRCQWYEIFDFNIEKVKHSSLGIKDSFYFVQYVVREELDGGRICINVNFDGGEGVLIESETLVLLLNLFANKDANKNAAQMIATTN